MVLKKNPLLFHEAVQIVDPCWQVARSDMNACLTSRKTPKPSRGSGAARQTLCTASAAQLCAPVAVDPERELVRKSERGPSEAHTPRGSIGKWGGWWTSRQQVLWHPIPSSDLVASGVLFPPRCWAKGGKKVRKGAPIVTSHRVCLITFSVDWKPTQDRDCRLTTITSPESNDYSD